eukprot:TRINITY_DN61031_c0_g1_i1.p1 TRINITY_DN61031_c0_g1~~TRINITY_DN61031_c0_g1_i1.p1  ORF type:complete len:899 (+),score=120.60 TRINITY_DN61031_c0_g1_i1:3-2699(+)
MVELQHQQPVPPQQPPQPPQPPQQQPSAYQYPTGPNAYNPAGFPPPPSSVQQFATPVEYRTPAPPSQTPFQHPTLHEPQQPKPNPPEKESHKKHKHKHRHRHHHHRHHHHKSHKKASKPQEKQDEQDYGYQPQQDQDDPYNNDEYIQQTTQQWSQAYPTGEPGGSYDAPPSGGWRDPRRDVYSPDMYRRFSDSVADMIPPTPPCTPAAGLDTDDETGPSFEPPMQQEPSKPDHSDDRDRSNRHSDRHSRHHRSKPHGPVWRPVYSDSGSSGHRPGSDYSTTSSYSSWYSGSSDGDSPEIQTRDKPMRVQAVLPPAKSAPAGQAPQRPGEAQAPSAEPSEQPAMQQPPPGQQFPPMPMYPMQPYYYQQPGMMPMMHPMMMPPMMNPMMMGMGPMMMQPPQGMMIPPPGEEVPEGVVPPWEGMGMGSQPQTPPAEIRQTPDKSRRKTQTPVDQNAGRFTSLEHVESVETTRRNELVDLYSNTVALLRTYREVNIRRLNAYEKILNQTGVPALSLYPPCLPHEEIWSDCLDNLVDMAYPKMQVVNLFHLLETEDKKVVALKERAPLVDKNDLLLRSSKVMAIQNSSMNHMEDFVSEYLDGLQADVHAVMRSWRKECDHLTNEAPIDSCDDPDEAEQQWHDYVSVVNGMVTNWMAQATDALLLFMKNEEHAEKQLWAEEATNWTFFGSATAPQGLGGVNDAVAKLNVESISLQHMEIIARLVMNRREVLERGVINVAQKAHKQILETHPNHHSWDAVHDIMMDMREAEVSFRNQTLNLKEDFEFTIRNMFVEYTKGLRKMANDYMEENPMPKVLSDKLLTIVNNYQQVIVTALTRHTTDMRISHSNVDDYYYALLPKQMLSPRAIEEKMHEDAADAEVAAAQEYQAHDAKGKNSDEDGGVHV